MTNLFLLIIATALAEAPCVLKRQALYDVGSGSTKMAVIQTNSCKKVPETLLTGYEKVDYKEDLSNSKNSEFSEEVQQAGLAALKKLKSEAEKLKPDLHRGIATAAFREALNAPRLAEKIETQVGIPIEIISQGQEGKLAYMALKLYYDEPSLLAWDIGGASFQLTAFDPLKKEWSVYKGGLASVVFKEKVLAKIKKKKGLTTPNPLTKTEIKQARKLVVKELSRDMQNSFVLKNRYRKVVGLGSVLARSQKRYLGKSVFSVTDIENWLRQNHKKTDAELNDPYAATVVTNMILVSEMMKILKIDSVEVADVALVEGLLSNPY